VLLSYPEVRGLPLRESRDGRVTDWAYRADEPRGAVIGINSYWWDENLQGHFDQLWTREADAIVDLLIDRYSFYWPYLAWPALAAAEPVITDAITEFTRSNVVPDFVSAQPTGWCRSITEWGSFHEKIAGTSCTVVLIGKCTWARRYVDWEIAATLRNFDDSARGGLIAVQLPSAEAHGWSKLPPGLEMNVSSAGRC
jgi:hypothetical protein